ncbi:transcription initiation factor TFIID subunit 4b-like isoform X2 [Primulina huaijiensis]|uniref:transcription initiation factor TFIID subunit 4b-like isoform X2 n=1 Tax=Primulina huaijiensis TaxID=1492673 RepID=UPI003CC6EFD1
MRATAANVAGRAATGVGDMMLRWQLMIEAKQKLGGTETLSGSQSGKEVAWMPSPTSTRNTKENQEAEKRDHSQALSTPVFYTQHLFEKLLEIESSCLSHKVTWN